MRARFLGVALTTLALTMTAHADAVFIPGNNAPSSHSVISIGTQRPGFGGAILGVVNGTNVGGVSVIATSARDTLVGGSNGITAASGLLHDVDLIWPGFGFPFVIINPFKPVRPDLIVTVSLCTLPPGSLGCTSRSEQTYPPSGALYGTSNQNFLTITTVNFEKITEVKIESNGGFENIEQIRAGNTNVGAGIPDAVIPEPSSMLLLGSGLLLLTGLLRRKLL